MRELVYLSERKLRQFQAPARRRFTIREVGIPGIGQVGVDQGGGSHLDAVIAHLEGVARWYEEDVPVGQWVQFEARLSHRVLAGGDSAPDMLLFAEPLGHTGRRLVLHGSPEHLLDYAPSAPPAEWRGDRFLAMSASRGEVLRPLIRFMADDTIEGMDLYQLEFQLSLLSRFLDQKLDPHTASWLAGYARVTVDTTGQPVVVASPLYVEYVPPPDQ